MRISTLAFLVLIVSHGESLGKSTQKLNNWMKATRDWQNRVIGGRNATKGDFPYVAAVLSDSPDFDGASCTASIIDIKWILTAAHCLDETFVIDVSQFFVAVGEVVVSHNSPIYPVAHFYTHPLYNYSELDIPAGNPKDIPGITQDQMKGARKHVILNDIGLLKLKGKLTWSFSVAPIRLGSIGDVHGDAIVVTGYGAEYFTDARDVRRLNYLILRTVKFEKCAERYFWFMLMEQETQLCAVKGPYDTPYKGDSGAPLVDLKSGKQVGLTSFTISEGYPPVFTRVSQFMPWIKDVTGLTFE